MSDRADGEQLPARRDLRFEGAGLAFACRHGRRKTREERRYCFSLFVRMGADPEEVTYGVRHDELGTLDAVCQRPRVLTAYRAIIAARHDERGLIDLLCYVHGCPQVICESLSRPHAGQQLHELRSLGLVEPLVCASSGDSR